MNTDETYSWYRRMKVGLCGSAACVCDPFYWQERPLMPAQEPTAKDLQSGQTGARWTRRLFVTPSTDREADLRLPLAVAMLSVIFQQWLGQWVGSRADTLAGNTLDPLWTILVLVSAALVLFERSSRWGVVLFSVTAMFALVPLWTFMANHTWLALWTIPVAVFFAQWWRSDLYALYLRLTFALVMLAAFAQKLLAGTYLDGSYIYWLSSHGSMTEQLFAFACDTETGIPCIWHRLAGQVIMGWQLAVAILLAIGVRNLLFLTVEIGFLLGAGIFADEMNFQVLNVCLLCIIFKVGMPRWLVLTCLALLVLDLYGIGYFAERISAYVL